MGIAKTHLAPATQSSKKAENVCSCESSTKPEVAHVRARPATLKVVVHDDSTSSNSNAVPRGDDCKFRHNKDTKWVVSLSKPIRFICIASAVHAWVAAPRIRSTLQTCVSQGHWIKSTLSYSPRRAQLLCHQQLLARIGDSFLAKQCAHQMQGQQLQGTLRPTHNLPRAPDCHAKRIFCNM